MPDIFSGYEKGLTSPPTAWVAVTPHNTNDLAQTSRALLITSAGNVEVIDVAGNTSIIPVAAVPFILPGRFTRVKATGTTVAAGNIFNGY
jgi:hypothetical protein